MKLWDKRAYRRQRYFNTYMRLPRYAGLPNISTVRDAQWHIAQGESGMQKFMCQGKKERLEMVVSGVP